MSAELKEALAFWDKLDKFGLPESRIGVIVEAARQVAEADEGPFCRVHHCYWGDPNHFPRCPLGAWLTEGTGWAAPCKLTTGRLLLPAEEEKLTLEEVDDMMSECWDEDAK